MLPVLSFNIEYIADTFGQLEGIREKCHVKMMRKVFSSNTDISENYLQAANRSGECVSVCVFELVHVCVCFCVHVCRIRNA